jgi:hypothetical protein
LILLCGGVLWLGGCASTGDDDLNAALTVLDLKAEDYAQRRFFPAVLERPWAGRPLPAHLATPDDEADAGSAEPIDVHVRLRQAGADPEQVPPRSHIVRMPPWQAAAPGVINDAAGEANPVVLVVDRPGLSMTFAGQPLDEKKTAAALHGGVARITLHDPFIAAAQRIEPQLSVQQLLLLGLRDLSAEQLRGYAALDQQPTYDQVIELADQSVDPAWIAELNHAGYGFSVDELIALKAAGVPTAKAVALRDGGLVYDADQLIALHEADVSAAYALGMKEAGYAESADALIRLREAGVTTAYAAAMRQREVAGDTQTLLDVHAAEVTPRIVDTYEEAGYALRAAELLILQEAGVMADDALAFKEAGYDFSLADLLKLRRWQVPGDYVLALVSDEFTPLTADQVVDLRLRKVSPELVRSLRQPQRDATAQHTDPPTPTGAQAPEPR